ncbi:MAG: hypothetical protein HQL87_09350 [Magnetococcales bacterium]|nr:hypothetical protein [Magnetococcales bacterium]
MTTIASDTRYTLATRAAIAELKADLASIRWMLGMVLAGVAAIFLKVFFLH